MDILNNPNNSLTFDSRNKALGERAMLPIVKYPSFIECALPHFEPIFNQSQLRHFAEYLTGLIVSENKTINGINDHFLNHTDQSAKNHFLTDSKWDDTKLTAKRLDLILEQCRMKRVTEGLLVIDDTLAHKTGEHIEAVDWFWDHSNHKYTLSHQVVSSQFVAKDFHVPIDSRLYRKEEDIGKEHFQSKLDLAVQLIDQAVEVGIPFSRVAGDSWYFCDKIIKHLEHLRKDWIFASKSNRTININNYWIQLKDFVKELKPEDFKQVTITKTNGKQLTVFAFSRTVYMRKVGRVKVIISYLKEPLKGNPFFLVTNRKDWTIDTILSCYAQRWPIETFYKDAKQNLGFESCEMRRIRGIRRHWNLVFLAYTLLEFESSSGPLKKWIKSNVVTIGGKCRMASSEIVRSFIFWTYHHLNQGLDPDTVFSKTFQNSKQLKFAL
jgi:SRSO17 transposase